jgi:hypothetical protein
MVVWPSSVANRSEHYFQAAPGLIIDCISLMPNDSTACTGAVMAGNV